LCFYGFDRQGIPREEMVVVRRLVSIWIGNGAVASSIAIDRVEGAFERWVLWPVGVWRILQVSDILYGLVSLMERDWVALRFFCTRPIS